jgi:hypothetical protein
VENVEDFNSLGSMITIDAKCTREIKARIAMVKAAFNKKTLFASKYETWNRKLVIPFNLIVTRDRESQYVGVLFI